jgi:hypothetical protein
MISNYTNTQADESHLWQIKFTKSSSNSKQIQLILLFVNFERKPSQTCSQNQTKPKTFTIKYLLESFITFNV